MARILQQLVAWLCLGTVSPTPTPTSAPMSYPTPAPTFASPSCSFTHLLCPVPDGLRAGYHVLGFADVEGCQVSQTETGPALNVSVDACNVTQDTSEAGELTFAITIAPPGSGTQAALILTSDIFLECSCTLGVAATSGSGFILEAVSTALSSAVSAGDTTLPVASTVGFSVGATVYIEGGGNSETGVIASIGSLVLTSGLTNSYPAVTTTVTLTATAAEELSISNNILFEVSPVESFADSAYQQAALNGSLSEVGGRYYFQVASIDDGMIVGLQECSASPTSDPADPSSVAFLEDSCPVGELLVQSHASGSHEARFSTRAFKFSMMPEVHISCTVVRCASQPCGTCAGSRRLAPRRASGAAAESTSAAFLLQLPDAGSVYYLPTAPTLSMSASTPDAAVDDYGLTVTEVKTMISNVPAVVASDIETFSSVFASTVSEYLVVPLDTVVVLSVDVTMAEGMGRVRRLEVDPPGTIEAMLVHTLVTGLAWEGARSDEFDGSAPNFTGALTSMLEASFSVDMGDISLLVAKRLLTAIAEPAGAVAHDREQDHSSSVAVTLAWACGAASGLVLLLGFAAFARCLLRRLHGSSPGATEKTDVDAGQVSHGHIIHL